MLDEDCVAAVLIGGASRRMGVDTATLDIGGVALGRVVAEALGVNDGRMVIACGGTAETAGALGLAHLADDRPGEVFCHFPSLPYQSLPGVAGYSYPFPDPQNQLRFLQNHQVQDVQLHSRSLASINL